MFVLTDLINVPIWKILPVPIFPVPVAVLPVPFSPCNILHNCYIT